MSYVAPIMSYADYQQQLVESELLLGISTCLQDLDNEPRQCVHVQLLAKRDGGCEIVIVREMFDAPSSWMQRRETFDVYEVDETDEHNAREAVDAFIATHRQIASERETWSERPTVHDKLIAMDQPFDSPRTAQAKSRSGAV